MDRNWKRMGTGTGYRIHDNEDEWRREGGKDDDTTFVALQVAFPIFSRRPKKQNENKGRDMAWHG